MRILHDKQYTVVMRRIVNPAAHRLVGPRSFYTEAFLVMLPAMLQQAASSTFNFVDNLMVGRVDAQTLAGVAVANRLFLIFSGIFWGLTGTGAMLISQYRGADDRDECERLFILQVVSGFLIALAFVLVMTLFPRQILGWFVQDPVTLQHGLDYLSIVRFSYFPAALTMVGLFSMRAIGHNHMPLVAGITGMVVNLSLNWVLIFGQLGFPALGARGAAMATLAARILEASMYMIWIALGRTLFSWNIWSLKKLSAPVARMMLRKSVPLIINEFLYTAGLSLMFWSVSRLQEHALPAAVIADQAIQLLMIIFGGMANGVTIMVGQRLGAGQFDQARANARLLLVFQGALAGIMTGVTVILAPFIARWFSLSPELEQVATRMIWIQAAFLVPSIIFANIFFVLRAGGDMRSAFKIDALLMWLLPVPAGVALALIFPGIGTKGLLLAYGTIYLLHNIKIIPGLHYFRRGDWVRNLTLKH